MSGEHFMNNFCVSIFAVKFGLLFYCVFIVECHIVAGRPPSRSEHVFSTERPRSGDANDWAAAGSSWWRWRGTTTAVCRHNSVQGMWLWQFSNVLKRF